MPFRPFANPDTAPTALRLVLICCRALVFTFVLFGVASLLASVSGQAWLTQPAAGWAAMGLAGGIASIAIGIGLWGRIGSRRTVSLAGAGVALAVGILSLVGSPSTPAYLLAPISALLVIIASVGLLSGVIHLRPDFEKVTLGLAGLALVALSTTVVFAHAVGVFGRETAGSVPGTSLQLVITSLLLGLCYIALPWSTGLKELEPPSWLPAAAGLASLITVVSLWSALAERERAQAAESIRQAAVSQERFLRREIEMPTQALLRSADAAAAGISLTEQEGQLRGLYQDIPSLQSLHRLAKDGTPLFSVPLGTDVEAITALWNARDRDLPGGTDTLMFLPLDSATNRFVIFAPVCDHQCTGAVAGVIRSDLLFKSTLTDTLGLYRFGISGASGPLQGSNMPDDWPSGGLSGQPLVVGAVRWELAVWPAQTGGVRGSNLPGTVLFMGLIVTLLLPLTFQLGRSAWEGARERERARLAFALDRSTDGLWEMHLESGLAVRSAALWNHLQYPPEEVPPDIDGWMALIHPDDRDAVNLALAAHLAGDRDSYESEYRVRAGDGSWHTVVDRGRVVDRDGAGEPLRLLGISADVTRARAVAREREANEKRFRALFNSGFQFKLLLSADCAVLEVNQTALDHAGLTVEEVVGRACWDTLWWADNAAAQQILRDACTAANAGGTETWEQEVRLPGKALILLEVSLKPIHHDGTGANQLLVEARDVTERRRVEAGQKELDTLTTMGRVAARVAHEINNPLAGIQNAFLLIKDAVPESHPHHAYVGAIEREIERISRVTRQLYETYRPERDTTGHSSVRLVVGDAVAFLQQVNRSKGMRIETDMDGIPDSVPIPAAMLRQIIYNLVQNAVDASPPDGTVEVVARAVGNALEFQVRDQGPGVPAALQDQIFDPFFTTKEKGMETSGMGLGLALVQRTVVAAGGTITVATRPKGGAEFTVNLPGKVKPAERSS